MQLDLRYMGQLAQRYTFQYNKIAKDLRPQFNNLLEKLGKDNAQNLDWWVSGPASRNPFVSKLFHYCCCISLLKSITPDDNEKISEIKTDSKELNKIIKDQFGHNVRLSIKYKLFLAEYIIVPIARIVYAAISLLILFLWAHIPLKKNPITHHIVLIDTYVTYDFIDEDRYYLNLLENVPEKYKKYIFFAPTYHGFKWKDYQYLFKKIKNSKRNFLVKELYLKTADYLYAFKHIFRLLSLKIPPVYHDGINITPLVKEELYLFQSISSAFTGLINYRFAYRLKASNIQIDRVINWFENQAIDKGWNLGFNHFYPNSVRVGYQGFVGTDFLLNYFPTNFENQCQLYPSLVAVMGEKYVKIRQEFCNDVTFIVAPAYRFQSLWSTIQNQPVRNDSFKLVIALPIIEKDAFLLLDMVQKSLTKLRQFKIHASVKPHPAVSKIGRIADCFHLLPTKTPLNEIIAQANCFISGVSTSCLEAVVAGVPVIVFGNQHGLTHNPIPATIPKNLWHLCYTADEIADHIRLVHDNQPDKIHIRETQKKIREEYFEPVTQKGTCDFLGLNYE